MMTRCHVLLLVVVAGCGEDTTGGTEADAQAAGGADAATGSAMVLLESRFPTTPRTIGDGISEFTGTLEAIAPLKVMQVTSTDPNRILDRVNDGSVDLGIDILLLQTSGRDATLDAVLDLYGESIPFGPQPEEYMGWMESGGGITLLLEILRSKGYSPNLVIRPVIVSSGQTAGMFKGAVTDARLGAGFLMRSFGYGQAVLRRAYPQMKFIGAQGGSVANIVAGFGGTLTGADCSEAGTDPCTLGGAEFNVPCVDLSQIYSQGIAGKGVTHYALTEWQSPATISFVFYRKDNAKLASHAALIDIAARANVGATHQRVLTDQSQCLKEIVDLYGQKLSRLPDDVLTKLRAATPEVLDGIAAGNADFARALTSMRTFSQNNQTWWNQGYVARAFRFVGWSTWQPSLPVE
jgi:TRAP-type mannitol/chloroaromatic compound transport system substrate-binding protein